MGLARIYRFERPAVPLKTRVADVLKRSDEAIRKAVELQERLGHDSGLGSDVGNDRRRAGGADKFRPDQVPVVRPKIPAADRPAGGLLDCSCVLRAGAPLGVPVLPLTNLGGVPNANGGGEGRNAHCVGTAEVSDEVHSPIVVANAIAMQAAFAIPRVDTLLRMTTEAVKAHRIERLKALIDQHYGKSPVDLSDAMGLKNSAFIRQMLLGMRPITEKTITKIEALDKTPAGWFGETVATEDGEPFVITAEERDVILTLRARRSARKQA